MSTKISRKHAPLLTTLSELYRNAIRATEKVGRRRPLGMRESAFFSNLLSEINAINLDLNVQIAYIMGELLERGLSVPVCLC